LGAKLNITAFALVLFNCGCSLSTSALRQDPEPNTEKWHSPVASSEADRIAGQIVEIFKQLPRHHPEKSTIQISPTTNELGSSLESRFTDAGYGIQRVTDDQGQSYLKYSIVKDDIESECEITVAAKIGHTEVSRDYVSSQGTLVPTSAFLITGHPPSPVSLDEGGGDTIVRFE